jgi:hypothetical protein
MGKRIIVDRTVCSQPVHIVSRKKNVETNPHEYAQRDFLHDEAPHVSNQVNSNLRETRFSKGFFRKPHQSIQPERPRVEMEQEREAKREQRVAHRQEYVRTNVKPTNPITGDNMEQKMVQHRSIKAHPAKLLHDAQKPYIEKRNLRREELVKNDGLILTKKDYSVSDYFKEYHSYA